jgi:hypothetical protein
MRAQDDGRGVLRGLVEAILTAGHRPVAAIPRQDDIAAARNVGFLGAVIPCYLIATEPLER